MKTYRIEHTRPGADDPCDEWVPAEVAQGLYDALVQARGELEEIALAEIGEAYNSPQINDALAAADGEDV